MGSGLSSWVPFHTNGPLPDAAFVEEVSKRSSLSCRRSRADMQKRRGRQQCWPADDLAVCSASGWFCPLSDLVFHVFPPPSCPEYDLEPCQDPGTPRFGRHTGSKFGIGDSVAFYCNTGYRLQGAKEVVCLGGGRRMWSAPLPRCVGTWSAASIPFSFPSVCVASSAVVVRFRCEVSCKKFLGETIRSVLVLEQILC